SLNPHINSLNPHIYSEKFYFQEISWVVYPNIIEVEIAFLFPKLNFIVDLEIKRRAKGLFAVAVRSHSINTETLIKSIEGIGKQ
ncbi:hypothetical protein ACERII_23695, partial [Evansella sp. AB-rgal1]|uniref:hypothetical protein n=1 Tax=Evansella sp. AB-rgal1 TaxID=3242696 RepID=UPI00359DB3EC